METSLLLEVLQTRMEANDNNPTSGSFLYELYLKLTELKEREDRDAANNKK